MRKYSVLFAFALAAAMLCGCGAATQSDPAEKLLAATALPCSFTGAATLREVTPTVEFSLTKGCDSLMLELLAPPEVAGLRVEFLETSTTVTYRELVMNLAPGDIPQESLFVALRDVFAALPQAVVTQNGGEAFVSGKAGLTEYQMLWDAKTRKLQKILLPTMGVTISVKNFQNAP